MYEFSFHHLLAFLIDFSNSWAPRQLWKLLYAPMRDLLRFSKPAFDQIRMASKCIQISHVIIYFGSLWLHRVGYFTLIQYRLVLCSNFSLFVYKFACLISNFVSAIVLSLGFNFHTPMGSTYPPEIFANQSQLENFLYENEFVKEDV